VKSITSPVSLLAYYLLIFADNHFYQAAFHFSGAHVSISSEHPVNQAVPG
jgi:hypothetical protein